MPFVLVPSPVSTRQPEPRGRRTPALDAGCVPGCWQARERPPLHRARVPAWLWWREGGDTVSPRWGEHPWVVLRQRLTPKGWTCPGNGDLPAVSLRPCVSSQGLSVGPRAGKCPWGRGGQVSFSPGCSSPIRSSDPLGRVRHGVCFGLSLRSPPAPLPQGRGAGCPAVARVASCPLLCSNQRQSSRPSWLQSLSAQL